MRGSTAEPVEPTPTEPQIAQISQTTCWYKRLAGQGVLSDVGGDEQNHLMKLRRMKREAPGRGRPRPA